MAVDRIRLARALAAIATDSGTPAELPDRLCQTCVTVLPVDGVGVSLVSREHSGGRALLGASDSVSAQIEELQFDLGEGPCISAFGDGQPVLVADLRADDLHARWPMFTRAVQAIEAVAIFAFPLQLGAIGIGVLDCYRARAGPLREVTEALTVADAVTLALLNLQARLNGGPGPAEGTELFDLSWRDHAEVHQATGALAAQLDISTDEALARLRAYAFRHARPLRVVAADVMARRLQFEPNGDGSGRP
ncbi:GAF and ANTAR domain-containing protein [Amycolatopsis pigmentata]|uniref:GAF and ANTAR domain-containing protein n=1 Tax=Amycolatopsis pigmentata TaxID=450801 RepID=A0ABW5FY93_9PSEU